MFAEVSDAVQITNAILSFLSVLLAPLVALLLARLKTKDAEIKDEKAKSQDLASVATDAVRVMQVAVDKKREAEGLPPVKPVADVKPEHHSPVTEAQQATADQATLRAAVTAAALELGVPARENPPGPGPKEKAGGEAPDAGSAEASEDLVSKAEVVAAVLAVKPPEPEPEAEKKG